MVHSRFVRRKALRGMLALAGSLPALRTGTLFAASRAAVPLRLSRAADAAVADSPLDYRTPGGHYFGQTSYSVRNLPDGPQFWSEMQRLGSVDLLGYPISRPFQALDGFWYQAFQRALLQWRPEVGQAWLANIMDWLHDKNLDDWLLTLGVPRQMAGSGSATDFGQIRAERLNWLTNDAIRRHFTHAGTADHPVAESTDRGLERFGLPTSRPEEFGPFIAQRFQRGVLQVWTLDLPGMPASGTVVGALAGDLVRQAGLLPRQALAPEPPPAPALLAYLAISPPQVPQGHAFVVRVWAPAAAEVTGALGERPLLLAQRGEWWIGIGGIPRLQPPGPLPLRLEGADQTGARPEGAELLDHVQVVSGGYPVERIWMGQDQLALLDPDTVRAEIQRLEAVTTQLTPQRLWHGPFQRPVTARVTSSFGIRRSINGGPPTSAHSGVDYGAPAGTPVTAAAAGRIALADHLAIRGNAVYIDHGLGVFTGYLHLSRIDVRVGETVRRGQVLGVVGSTGFSNGPHLHWEVRVGSVAVHPADWIQPAEYHDL